MGRAAVAAAEADPGLLAQVGIHGLAFGHGIEREFVAEIVEGEFEAIRKLLCVGDGFGQIGEELLHLLRRFQVTLGVAGEQASGGGERTVMADGSEGVREFAGFGDGVVDAVGRQQREMECLGQIDRNAIAGFFFAVEVALEFDVNILGAEDGDELIDLFSGFLCAALLQGCGERAFVTAGKADQAFGVFFEFLCRDGALAFPSAQLHFGDEPAEVLVTGTGLNQ